MRLMVALRDILTPTNFVIGLAAASIGYLIFEFLRKKHSIYRSDAIAFRVSANWMMSSPGLCACWSDVR
jgi:hypothetical protein